MVPYLCSVLLCGLNILNFHLLFLIACMCSLYVVQNVLPDFPTYLSNHKGKSTRRILADVGSRRQKSVTQYQIQCSRFIFGSYAVPIPTKLPNMRRLF
jgi:hypothetical protein